MSRKLKINPTTYSNLLKRQANLLKAFAGIH